MSSTNSSECESCEYSQCTYSFESNHNEHGQCTTNSRHVPIYATMAQPLIYYAQVQPLNRRQNNNQLKKENPFKKAFKWYTQERKATCCENQVAPERSGFAHWLDNKYCEYLHDSGQQPTSNEPRTNTCIANSCQCQKPTKRSRRFKSPWSKRTCPANDSGDVAQKCPDGSCEYILKPKELSRAASENCYHVPTSGKSNVTIVSLHMPCNTKCSRRSQSLSDVSREKYAYNKHGETVPLTVQKGTYISCECPQLKIEWEPCVQQKIPEAAVQVPSKLQDSRNQPEAPCTCQKEKNPEPVKVKSIEQDSRNQRKQICTWVKEKIPLEVIVVSQQLDSRNQPELTCACQNEKLPEMLRELSTQLDSRKQQEPPCTCSQERAPPCTCLQERAPPCTCSQEKAPPCTCLQERTPPCTCSQERAPPVVKVPSRAQESTNDLCCKCGKKNVRNVVQVPSEDQGPRNLSKPCCSCHLKKVPQVVQVPSQCRAVERSCQCPEQKVVPVCEETQYETAPTPLRSAQNHAPCCCKTCNSCKSAAASAPEPLQPQIFCIPVKVQDRKISNPDTCLTVAPSVQCESPKKQIKVKQCTTFVATQCGEEITSKVPSQGQHEICVCGKNNPSSSHEQRQGLGSIPLKRASYSTVDVNKETGEYSIMKEVAVVNKLTRCLTCVSNGAAQTSDHSIRFENDGACSCAYPLLFKIVCADVAKNE